MEAKFTPIAMRCNQEQFEAIKPKLEKFAKKIVGYSFNQNDYLVNNANDVKLYVENFGKSSLKNYNRTVYEAWDEETFLRACGIEVEETLTVSKEFILDLHANPTKEKIEKEFPQLFEKKMKVGKWYKHFYNGNDYLINYQGAGLGYGFLNGVFSSNWLFVEQRINLGAELATKEEVKTTLINELWKKFKVDDKVKCVNDTETTIRGKMVTFYFNKNIITLDDNLYRYELFNNGKWATIIEQPTEMTVAEIEAKLGHSVKIVK